MRQSHDHLIFSCDQAALQMVFSVRLSVCLQLMTSCCIKFAIISNGFTSPFGKKEKKNCHLYNTILSLYISRHYKKSLLRSQIYHGYEELSTDTNYPIWRRQKLPYMKKTRKKKQVCGAACFMAAEIKFSEDVRPSVTPFWLCSPHRIIMKFSGVITNDKSKVHAKGQGQRSKVKVTEVTTQLNRFRTVTPVWILIWWWNDAYSLMLLRRGALLFFKVIRQISRSHGSKNRQIWPRLGVSGL